MTSFTWGNQFVTGLQLVDGQHQQLVGMINSLGEAITESSHSDEYFLNMFDGLTAYAQEHFSTEAKFLREMGVDQRHIVSHLKQHADFVNDISNMSELDSVENSEDRRALLEYLVHWLAYHILGTDQNMARQIEGIKSGLSPEEAYERGEREASDSTEPLVVALSGLFALVSKRNKALRDLNQNLEERVAERTKELSKANEALKKISITDHLTGVPNRRFAMGQLQLHFEEAIAEGQHLSCLMIDADGFKEINDTYGHDAGDAVLKRLAKELKDAVRSDDIVCRLGGDEFFIICPNTDLEGARHLAELARNKIAGLKVSAGKGHWLGSVSIGVAGIARDTKDITSLLKEADEAVYEAKRCGKNCVKTFREV